MAILHDLFPLLWHTRIVTLQVLVFQLALMQVSGSVVQRYPILQLPAIALFCAAYALSFTVWLLATRNYWRSRPVGEAWYQFKWSQVATFTFLSIVTGALLYPTNFNVAIEFASFILFFNVLPLMVLENLTLKSACRRAWLLLRQHPYLVLISTGLLLLARTQLAKLGINTVETANLGCCSYDGWSWGHPLAFQLFATWSGFGLTFLASMLSWPPSFLIYQRYIANTDRLKPRAEQVSPGLSPSE